MPAHANQTGREAKVGPVSVIVLAAGRGVRMRSALPKVLHPIAGKPMINHVLAAAAGLAPSRTVVVVGAGSDAIHAAVAPSPTVVQDPPLGTGHAVMTGFDMLGAELGTVLVLFGDTPLITAETLARLVAARERGAVIAVLSFRPSDPTGYGRLVVTPDGLLHRIIEHKDATETEQAIGLCNGGVMAVDAARLGNLLAQLDQNNAQGEYYLTDIVHHARVAEMPCTVVEAPCDEVLGVNARADLARVEAAMQRRLRAAAMAGGATLIDPETVYLSCDTVIGHDVVLGPNVVVGPGVEIGDRVTVKPFSHVEGARIEDDAVVGPFARLRPGARIEQQVHIGNFVEVKNAVIERGAKVNHLTYIGDARVGAGANIGAGTITCNYDGFDKHVTDIGAGAFIGSNSALVAPVKIGDGAYVGSGSVITDDVPADALALGRGRQVERVGWARAFRERKTREKARRKTSDDGSNLSKS